MNTIAVFGDYLDYTSRLITVTAGSVDMAARELRREIARLGAVNIKGPFDVRFNDNGSTTYTPRVWPDA